MSSFTSELFENLPQVESLDLDVVVVGTVNGLARLRQKLRKPLAEFLGTMILLLLGTGVDCQVGLSSNVAVSASPKGNFLSVCMGWGAGAAFGIWSSIAVSGGHINPAVTLVLVLFRGLPWSTFFIYAPAQLAGAFVGSAVIYGVHSNTIDLYEGGKGIRTIPGSAGFFVTFPMDHLSAVTCFFTEVLITALLVVIVLALTDRHNTALPSAALPFAIFLAVVALSSSLAMQTGGAMNPARDLGPRLFLWMIYGKEVFTYRSWYWLWTPLLGDFSGGIIGALIYDIFVYTGSDSWINSLGARPSLMDSRPHGSRSSDKVAKCEA